MASSQQICIVGNLVDDPELRFTASGKAVCNFRVVVSDRRYDKTKNEWVDGTPWFVKCNVWQDAAEHVAESLAKGHRIVVTGRMESRSYEAKDGSGKRYVEEMIVDEVAASLKWATVRIEKMTRGGGSSSGSKDGASAGFASDDPWVKKDDTFADEPPF